MRAYLGQLARDWRAFQGVVERVMEAQNSRSLGATCPPREASTRFMHVPVVALRNISSFLGPSPAQVKERIRRLCC